MTGAAHAADRKRRRFDPVRSGLHKYLLTTTLYTVTVATTVGVLMLASGAGVPWAAIGSLLGAAVAWTVELLTGDGRETTVLAQPPAEMSTDAA